MIDFKTRLSSLKDRRQGTKERAVFESSLNQLQKNRYTILGTDLRQHEVYENLIESDSVKYAIGAMAPVDAKSTKISFDEGNRVADSLIKSLNALNITATSEFQGSVALNIHIEGHSDVDVLIIKKGIVLVQKPYVSSSSYIDADDKRPMVDIIKELRHESEKILSKNFPATDVNTTNNKSIAMENGSLKRKVDIVPACWYDSIEYQSSNSKADRGIKIYHKGNHELLLNQPFKHMELIKNRDLYYSGNLKMVIRLMKNMIADMPEYKKNKVKKLSSYDLAAIAYHMDANLYMPYELRLGLVEKARRHLDNLSNNKTLRDSLYVPDNSRKIFNSEDYSAKVEALKILKDEITDLTFSIFKDLRPTSILGYDSNAILSKKIA